MPNNKRKICFIITSTIHYSRNFLILNELKKRDDVELHIVLGGAVISSRYNSAHFNVKEILQKEGHENIYELYFNIDGDDHIIKAKTVGIGILEFATVLNIIRPDLVVVRGDRFEMLAATVAAANMNITLAHIEGGDLSGTIDESIRHSITKLAHYHFATNEDSRKRVIRMGEHKDRVFNFGSPELEVLDKVSKNILSTEEVNIAKFGSGVDFDPKQDFLMVMYHPVTSETEHLAEHTRNLLDVIHESGLQTLWFWPNFDAGAEKISHELRSFREKTKDNKIRFLRYLPPQEFLSLLSKTKCLVGNSSSGIKECSYLGIPVVNVGSRQHKRLRAENVLDCGHGKEEILAAIKKQLAVGRYQSAHDYFVDHTSENISKILASCELITQKRFED